jgi:uncharacterized protein YecE (DUF72 family)
LIYIGTAGFSYQDWRGTFYPEKQDKKYMLEYYACRFPVVEVNSTWHALPSPASLLSMARRTSPDFQFIIKAYKGLTHSYQDNLDDFERFKEVIRPVEDHGKLGSILAQFPWGFKNTRGNRDYLRLLRERLGERELVVEFRNQDWLREESLELLRELELGFCCVDEPQLKGLMRPEVHLTTRTGYVRFHGRNYETWWDRRRQSWERYNYMYSEEELREWVPRLLELDDEAEKTYAIFNNHYAGKAPRNARMLAAMLPAERIAPVSRKEGQVPGEEAVQTAFSEE